MRKRKRVNVCVCAVVEQLDVRFMCICAHLDAFTLLCAQPKKNSHFKRSGIIWPRLLYYISGCFAFSFALVSVFSSFEMSSHRRHHCHCSPVSSIALFVYMSFIFFHMAIFFVLLLLSLPLHLNINFFSSTKSLRLHLLGFSFPLHAPPICTPNITLSFFLCLC